MVRRRLAALALPAARLRTLPLQQQRAVDAPCVAAHHH